MEKENLIENALEIGNYLIEELKKLPGVIEVRGKGLMIGIEMSYPIKDLRNQILTDYKILTGNSSNPNTIRLLPTLNITKIQADEVLQAFQQLCK